MRHTGQFSMTQVNAALHLVLGFEHQQVGDVSEGQTEADHLGLGDVVGELADVNDPGRHPGTSYVTFELLTVVAIGYRGNNRAHDHNFMTKKGLSFSGRAAHLFIRRSVVRS